MAQLDEITKEDYIMRMDLHSRNLYCYALHILTTTGDVAIRGEIPLGLVSAVREAETGNYAPLIQQEGTIKEMSLRH